MLQKRALLLEAEFANILLVTYGESTHNELRGLERQEKSPITSSSRARSFCGTSPSNDFVAALGDGRATRTADLPAHGREAPYVEQSRTNFLATLR